MGGIGGIVQRWIAFNGVGGLGIAVQLGILTLLLRFLDVPYLWATAVAVECAVLHNFVWHQMWTWCDRPILPPLVHSVRACGGFTR